MKIFVFRVNQLGILGDIVLPAGGAALDAAEIRRVGVMNLGVCRGRVSPDDAVAEYAGMTFGKPAPPSGRVLINGVVDNDSACLVKSTAFRYGRVFVDDVILEKTEGIGQGATSFI